MHKPHKITFELRTYCTDTEAELLRNLTVEFAEAKAQEYRTLLSSTTRVEKIECTIDLAAPAKSAVYDLESGLASIDHGEWSELVSVPSLIEKIKQAAGLL